MFLSILALAVSGIWPVFMVDIVLPTGQLCPLHRGVLNGGASEHKTKRIVKDKNQLQEQLTYLGSGFNVFCTFHFL